MMTPDKAACDAAAHKARCRRMALRTYDLAEQAEQAEIIGAYLVIAARWLHLGDSAGSALASSAEADSLRR